MKISKLHLVTLAAAFAVSLACAPSYAGGPAVGSFAPGAASGITTSGSASVTPRSLDILMQRPNETAPAPQIDAARYVTARDLQDAYTDANGRFSSPEKRALYSALLAKASTDERLKALSPEFLNLHPELAKNAEQAGLTEVLKQYHATK